MRNDSRLKFNKLCTAMAVTYGVPTVGNMFSATPTVEQQLADKIIETSDFLQKINVLGVDQMQGQKILGSVSALVGKRTNTTDEDRQSSNALSLDTTPYQLYKTEYDVHLKYDTIDAWAKFPDFYDRFTRYVRTAIAHARIKVGFRGVSVAAETDPDANPNGEDVNIGWIQLLRDYKSGSQFMTEGAVTDQIRIGGAGDYANLDAFVLDILQLIGDAHRDGADLVALMGRELLTFDKAQLYKAQGSTPTEKERIENGAVTRTYGGLPAHSVPFLPPRALIITSWDNLSLYYQNGAVRQQILDNAKRDRIEHFNTLNEGYVLEDSEKAASVEFANVKLWDGTAFV